MVKQGFKQNGNKGNQSSEQKIKLTKINNLQMEKANSNVENHLN